MIREQFIQIIGQYTTTEFSWLDIPWCFSALVVCILVYALVLMFGHIIRGI